MDFTKYINYANQYNFFVLHNHIRLTKMERDWAEAELTICRDSLNPLYILHGGAYFTISDTVASAAARSDGTHYVTLNSSFEFYHSVKTGKIYASAAVRHRGRTICLVAAEVKDEKGNLLAEGKFTMYGLGDPINVD